MQEGQIQGGYILLARKLFDSWLMDKPPLWMKLWVWMLGQANWKDRDKLKRGQFITTADDMKEAMSYHVGARICRHSDKEIRRAYEGLTKGGMVGRTKSTRGMVITICNYDLYQDFNNYEGHHEGQHEKSTKGQVGAQDTEYIENNRIMNNAIKTPRAQIATLYCQAFEKTTVPSIAWKQLDDILAKYPMEQIEEAFGKLVCSTGKTLSYLIGILEGNGNEPKQKGGSQYAKQPTRNQPASSADDEDPQYANFWKSM